MENPVAHRLLPLITASSLPGVCATAQVEAFTITRPGFPLPALLAATRGLQ
jgi:hypothetical protein